MKIEQIIVLHLYIKKQVKLQGIGTFRLDPSISLPAYNKAITLSENAITFEYDATAAEDASLIDSIVHYTKKLRPLATADLDSFLNWQKQLLNINMPFNLPDIGVLQKTSQGRLKFIPLQSHASTIGTTSSSAKIKKVVRSIFNKYFIAIDYSKKIIPVILIIFGIGLTTWVVYLLVIEHTPDESFLEKRTPTVTANNKITPTKKDTLKSTQSIKTINKQNVNDAYVFKVVFFETKSKNEALKTQEQAYGFGHSVIMYSKDSLYKIAIPFNRPLSDTLQVKDSLNQYYSLGKGYVEVE